MGYRSSDRELARRSANRAALSAASIATETGVDFQGRLITAADPDYEAARKEFNGAFDYHPALIAMCTTRSDVRIAIEIARAGKLPAVCRSGGHSTAGYSVQDNGMVIDLSRINDVNLHRDQGIVRIAAGASFNHINGELDVFGMHVPGGGCGEVCIGGYMQGGGYGFTSRMFGMNSDNVRSFQMMLANGQIVRADRERNYDLFWAVRGGTGNNFGVLLDVDYYLKEVRELTGFSLVCDLEHAPAVLLELQTNYMAEGASSNLGYMAFITKGDDGISALRIRGMYNGSLRASHAEIASLLAVPGVHSDLVRQETYMILDKILMEALPVVPALPDNPKEDKQAGYIEKMLTLENWREIVAYIDTPEAPPNLVVIEPYGGRINEIAVKDSAFVHRSAHMDFVVDVFWGDPSDKARAVAWLDGFMTLMQPHFSGMTYQNYPRATFSDYPLNYWGIDAYTELCAIKKKYDPGDFFTFPQAIGRWPGFKPSGGIGDAKLTASIRDRIAVEA